MRVRHKNAVLGGFFYRTVHWAHRADAQSSCAGQHGAHAHIQAHCHVAMLLASSNDPTDTTTCARGNPSYNRTNTLKKSSVNICERATRCCGSKTCEMYAQKRHPEHIVAAASAAAAVKICDERSIPAVLPYLVVGFCTIRWPLMSLLRSGGFCEAARIMCRPAC